MRRGLRKQCLLHDHGCRFVTATSCGTFGVAVIFADHKGQCDNRLNKGETLAIIATNDIHRTQAAITAGSYPIKALSLPTTLRTMKVSVAACAPGTPPDTGASTNCGAVCTPLGLQTPALRCTLRQA